MKIVCPVLAALLCAVPFFAQAPTFEGKTLLFGNLHAHSKLSDDIRGAGNDLLPIRGFESAHAHGLDFLAISDHHQSTDAPGRLSLTAAEYKTDLYDVAMAYNASNVGKFVAIPAIEWGNGATGNHVNVFGAPGLPPDTVTNTRYDLLYAWITTNAPFAQYNHPYSWEGESKRNKAVGNYGETLFTNTADFVAAAGAVRTVSIISSVAGGHLTGKFKAAVEKTHRDRTDKSWKHYLRFLNLGFHLSPAANQDTHGGNWGTVTAARTAVWADDFSYAGLMAGLKRNRVYATEDDELAVAFQVKHRNVGYWMGDTVPLSASEEDVELQVSIWQAKGSDNDATDEGPYTVTIYVDADGTGGHEAAVVGKITGVKSGETARRPLQVSPGQYVLIEVTEENGKDNPIGDGDDELNSATGVEGSDGRRDNLNDSAWTSPVWFRVGSPAATTAFVWSKNSKLYHTSDCWAVAQIGQVNRQEGTTAPGDKTKHNCTLGHP